MPQSIDEFLNSSTQKKNKPQSIDEFLNPPVSSYPIGDLISQGKLPPFSAADSELSRQAEEFAQQHPEAQPQPERPGRDIPVIGPVLKTLDTIGQAIEPVVGPVRSLYTPGAGLANVASFAGAAEAGISKLLPGLGSSLGGKVAQTAAREAITGAPLGTGQYLASGGNDTGEALQSGLYGAALGGALGGAGKAIGAGVKSLKDHLAFRQSIDEFIARTQKPRGSEDFVTHPNDALVQQAGGAKPANTGDQLAENFNRGEAYQKEFEQAVQDQYDFLKQSMDNRGGVDQGALLRDPTTGEVIDRIGRISNNPPWYQEFFAHNGRAPTNKELRDLAERQVKKGFQDNGGRIPSFKPEEIQKLDSEIADIQSTLPHMEGDVKTGLQQELERLRGQRERMAKVLPNGIDVGKPPEPVKEPTDLNELVKSKGFEQVTPETIAQTYNQKTWYHGTGTDKLTKDSLDPFAGSHESLFGQGVYLTDNPKIAEGYANSRGKRSKTPTVYEANVNMGRVLDLEKPITPDVAAAIDKTVKPLDYQYNYHFEETNHFSDLVNKMIKNGDTPEQIITTIRKEVSNFSHEAEIPTSEFVDNFQELAIYLKEAGYDGLTHTGGNRTGNEAHRVLILLDPQGHKWSRDVHPNQVTRLEKYNPDAGAQRKQPLPEGVSAMHVKGDGESVLRSEVNRSPEIEKLYDEYHRLTDELSKAHDRAFEFKMELLKKQGLDPHANIGELAEADRRAVADLYNVVNSLREKRTALSEKIKYAEKNGGRLPPEPSVPEQPVQPIAPPATPVKPAITPKTPEPTETSELPDVPRRGTTNTFKPISRTEVIQNLKNNLKVVIDTGRLGTSRKTVLGVFKRKSEVVRSRAMHDVATIAHEVGHALEKRFKLVDPQFQDEFMNILHKHSDIDMGAYKPSELQEEGFAEYMRLLLTDPKLAFEAAPKFSQHLLNKLPPNVVKALRASQSDIARWLQQDGLHSAMGKIDFVHGKTAKKFNFQRFYTKTFDDLNPLKLAMNALQGKRSHLMKAAEENVYKLARLSRGTAERAKLAISDGIYDESGRKIADGLGTIVKDLESIGVTEKELSTYLAVLHAQDLKQLGKEVPFTDAEIQAVRSELDSKAMRGIQQKIVKFNNALLDLLTESGVLSEKAVKDMRKKYPNYVPFMRFFDDDLQDGFQFGGFGSGKGFANLTNPIKRMTEEGSERTLIDPMESMVRNTFAVMNAAAKNRVGLSLLDLANTEGAGRLLEIVPGARSAREHVITVKASGENIAIKVRDPDLYDAILSLDKETANTLIRFLGAATNVLRGGATLTPEFMVRNATRDVLGAMVNVGFNPINFVKGFGYAISPGLRRMGFKNIENRVYEQFVTSGGAMSTLWGSSRDYTREAMKEAFKKGIKQKALNVIRNPKQLLKVWRPAVWLLKGLRTGAEISELSTKLGKFKSDLNKGASPLEAAFQARDLMDFNRAGSTIRSANQLIAFLNANLQGSDKMVREFSKDPAKFMMRGILTLTLPTVALHSWYSMMPEEQKKALLNIPNYQRDLFFLIPGPNNTFIRIPKPFEAGLLFSSSIDRVLRDMMEHEPNAYNGYFTNLATSFTPPVMIQFFNPILESLANYSFFRAAPIVPESLQGEQKKFQYDVYTSETAKLAGDLLSHTPAKNTPFASPKIIDNLIYGYTAGLGRYGTAGLDAGINLAKGGEDNPKPARNLEQNPFAAPFMANAQGSGELRNQFYDKYNALSEARKSAQTHPEIKFDAREYGRFHQSYNQMSKLNQQYKTILNNPNLTAEQKRDKLNVIDKQRNDLAYRTLYAK